MKLEEKALFQKEARGQAHMLLFHIHIQYSLSIGLVCSTLEIWTDIKLSVDRLRRDGWSDDV